MNPPRTDTPVNFPEPDPEDGGVAMLATITEGTGSYRASGLSPDEAALLPGRISDAHRHHPAYKQAGNAVHAPAARHAVSVTLAPPEPTAPTLF